MGIKPIRAVRAADLASARTASDRAPLIARLAELHGQPDAPAWEAPVALGARQRLPAFPADALPDWVCAQATAVAEFTQTPIDLAGCLALAALSTVAGGRAIARNTKPVSALSDPKVMRAVLDSAVTLLDGSLAAPSTVQRNRAILHNACEYAVELNLLARNPVKVIKWKAPKASSEIDRRSVVNHGQARRLLKAVWDQQPSGPRLAAFFAVLYYAGLRPEEAVNLHRENVTLPQLVWDEQTENWHEPADDWGELRFCTASPEVGAEWTDNGARRELRRLKGRGEGEWRHVPVAPPLTRILRRHLETVGPGPGVRAFCGVRGGELATITYRRV
ncbi:hypothetical protein AB0C69_00870 [Actinomadura sp. NPDC048032]|uniref:tyrosine-type recombinase/integrase n=1 Tax=Actinomadura sp. NPDC048032 TaxID=3155747 RepID=UPI0033D1748B